MGGKSEAGRGGSTGASAHVVIPLLHALAAGGCAEGRSVEKRKKGEGRRERECLGSTATAAAACQDERGKKKKAAGLHKRKHFYFSACLEKESGTRIDEKAFFPSIVMLFCMVYCRRYAWK